MRVLIIGASGIIGQHLSISVPDGVEVIFTRRHGDGFYEPLDVTADDLAARLSAINPNVIVNLAGENNPDAVERGPIQTTRQNVTGALALAQWCWDNGKHFVQSSSQAAIAPINAYGRQKLKVEGELESSEFKGWTIVRPSFVLGIRPFPAIGRENPAERILSGQEARSVNDRLFTACFAWDVARVIWDAVQRQPKGSTWNVGGVDGVSRLDIARYLGYSPMPISHDELLVMGFCERPKDTTYAEFSGKRTDAAEGFARLKTEYADRGNDTLLYKAKEVAAFFRIPHEQALAKLESGFRSLHPAVNNDFRAANPKTDDELLAWYRNTPSYIWELTAYHCDAGFNYSGMVGGIIERLKQNGVKSVLCLGDGTGDLTLACDKAGIAATYHDLLNSKTANFAKFRMGIRGSKAVATGTSTFTPTVATQFDAIVSLDYLEHVPNVEEWAGFVFASLKPGGIFVAQNAFAIGSGPDGSIPMHLACNDRWEKDWDPMLFGLGFVQLGPQWYQRPPVIEWPAMVEAAA